MTLLCRFFFTGLLLFGIQARAAETWPPDDPAAACERAGAAVGMTSHIPAGLLGAIAKVESGRHLSRGAPLRPWPWTIDANGHGYFYDTREDAIAAARDFQAQGVTSIDIGCWQINLRQHPDAFASLEEAFDPNANARYAARFLGDLFGKFQSWMQASGAYHSQTPALRDDYARRVMALWTGNAADPPISVAPLSQGFVFQRAPVRIPTAIAYGPPPRIIRNAGGPPALGGTVPGAGRTLAAYRAMPVRLAARFP